MDGPHDLGGKPGFGKIQVTRDDPPFHHEFQARMWGMAQCTDADSWTIDWWRHVRELIEEKDYLERDYFDSWAQTQLAAFINTGTITLEEGIHGTGDRIPTPEPVSAEQAMALDRRSAHRFDGEIDEPPAFNPGDNVRTIASSTPGHTRLPGYARDKSGIIHAWHGAHVLPDLSARGIVEYHHLYSVVFTGDELWPEQTGSNDRVYIDLWQDYLLEP